MFAAELFIKAKTTSDPHHPLVNEENKMLATQEYYSAMKNEVLILLLIHTTAWMNLENICQLK